MPTVDIRGVLTGIKNVAAFVFSSKVGLIVATAAFVAATLSTFFAFWKGLVIPSIDISSLGLSGEILGNSAISDVFLYCVHSDYLVIFLNWLISFVNAVVPFFATLIFTALVFKFGVFLKQSIGKDIREAT